MVDQSLIIQKIADLVVEEQTGVKRPKTSQPQDALVMDSVTISDTANSVRSVREAMNNKDEQRTAYVNSIKTKIEKTKYTITDEAAEKIARHILGLKI